MMKEKKIPYLATHVNKATGEFIYASMVYNFDYGTHDPYFMEIINLDTLLSKCMLKDDFKANYDELCDGYRSGKNPFSKISLLNLVGENIMCERLFTLHIVRILSDDTVLVSDNSNYKFHDQSISNEAEVIPLKTFVRFCNMIVVDNRLNRLDITDIPNYWMRRIVKESRPSSTDKANAKLHDDMSDYYNKYADPKKHKSSDEVYRMKLEEEAQKRLVIGDCNDIEDRNRLPYFKVLLNLFYRYVSSIIYKIKRIFGINN